MDDAIDFDLSSFKTEVRFSFLHPFWEAILSFDPLEFYVLLNDTIDLKGECKQSLTEEVYRCFCIHRFFDDEELVLSFRKGQLTNKNFLECDFMGGRTGFSTVLKFEFINSKVTSIYFVEPNHDMVVDRLFDLYTLQEIKDIAFIKNHD